jgi:hypothetical protein
MRSCTLRTNAVARWVSVSAHRNDRKQTLLFARGVLLREFSVFAKQLLWSFPTIGPDSGEKTGNLEK